MGQLHPVMWLIVHLMWGGQLYYEVLCTSGCTLSSLAEPLKPTPSYPFHSSSPLSPPPSSFTSPAPPVAHRSLQFCELAEILKLQKLCRERSGYNTSQIMTMIPIKRLAIELHWPCTSILLAVISLILARFPPNYFHFYLRTRIPVSPNYLKRRFKRIFLLNFSFFHISHNGPLPLD